MSFSRQFDMLRTASLRKRLEASYGGFLVGEQESNPACRPNEKG